MSNPYQAPNSLKQDATASPSWYVWFYKLYWPAWWGGTALIAGSWFGIVSPTVGWIGFGLAGLASLGSYLLPSLAGIRPEDYVVLDSRMLQSKDASYHNAIIRFQNGASLMHDGVAFAFRPGNEIACAVVAAAGALDDSSAMEIANHARSVFERLLSESPEFKSSVAGRTFRISILSGFDPNAYELCRVVDGQLEWKR